MARSSSNLLKADIPSMILLPSNHVFHPETINKPVVPWGYQVSFGLEVAHHQLQYPYLS